MMVKKEEEGKIGECRSDWEACAEKVRWKEEEISGDRRAQSLGKQTY